MKSKKFFFVFFLMVVSVKIAFAQSPMLIKEGNKLDVNITHQATEESLKELKKQLWDEHQIRLDFTHTAFDKNGHLSSISMSVAEPKGSSGTCSTMKLRKRHSAYFVVDSSPGASVAFQIGVGRRK
jgi:hypothetical protein